MSCLKNINLIYAYSLAGNSSWEVWSGCKQDNGFQSTTAGTLGHLNSMKLNIRRHTLTAIKFTDSIY